MESRTAVYLKGNVSVVVAYLSLLILIGDEPQLPIGTIDLSCNMSQNRYGYRYNVPSVS